MEHSKSFVFHFFSSQHFSLSFAPSPEIMMIKTKGGTRRNLKKFSFSSFLKFLFWTNFLAWNYRERRRSSRQSHRQSQLSILSSLLANELNLICELFNVLSRERMHTAEGVSWWHPMWVRRWLNLEAYWESFLSFTEILSVANLSCCCQFLSCSGWQKVSSWIMSYIVVVYGCQRERERKASSSRLLYVENFQVAFPR